MALLAQPIVGQKLLVVQLAAKDGLDAVGQRAAPGLGVDDDLNELLFEVAAELRQVRMMRFGEEAPRAGLARQTAEESTQNLGAAFSSAFRGMIKAFQPPKEGGRYAEWEL